MTIPATAPYKEHDITVEYVLEQVRDLPQESLAELSRFIEFLRFKTDTAVESETSIDSEDEPPLRIIRLGGLFKGYEFTPEEIAEARREMWKGLENFEL